MYTALKTSLRVHHHEWCRLLLHQLLDSLINTFSHDNMLEIEITILKISLNTQDFPFVRLSTEGNKYPQRCSIQTVFIVTSTTNLTTEFMSQNICNRLNWPTLFNNQIHCRSVKSIQMQGTYHFKYHQCNYRHLFLKNNYTNTSYMQIFITGHHTIKAFPSYFAIEQ